MQLEKDQNRLGVIIITYNNADLLDKQIECFKRFCKDSYELVVIDNSTEQSVIDAIEYKCKISGLRLIKTTASSQDGSDSHAFAANLSYTKLQGEFGFMLYLDHDCFPIKEFSVANILKDKVMAGLGQEKKGITYFWPGCVMWDQMAVNMAPQKINFSPEYGLDTGGALHRIMRELGNDKLIFFNERHMQNPEFNKSFYNFFSLINNGMFMHFVNGSNWNKEEAHDERINSLYNILTGFLQT